jgi:hypothetical protein
MAAGEILAGSHFYLPETIRTTPETLLNADQCVNVNLDVAVAPYSLVTVRVML